MMRPWLAAMGLMTAAFLMAAGCNTSVQVTSGCPAALPTAGASCAAPGESCVFQDGPCKETLSCPSSAAPVWQSDGVSCTPAAVDCWVASEGDVCAIPGDGCGEGDGPCGSGFQNDCGDDHRWHTSSIGGDCCDCCPDSSACPFNPPSDGQSCDPCLDSPMCAYDEQCGGGTSASCGDDGVWHVFTSDCPPPAMEPCYLFAGESDCALAPYCRWLVPGCIDPTVPTAGCYPIDDCTPGACAPSETCAEVNADPCYNKGCSACAATVAVCL